MKTEQLKRIPAPDGCTGCHFVNNKGLCDKKHSAYAGKTCSAPYRIFVKK